MNDSQTLFQILMGAGTIVLVLGVMLYIMSARYYNLKTKAKSLNVEHFETKLMVRRYEDLVAKCIEKDIKRDELMNKFFQGGISGDSMAILSHMDLEINNSYNEILMIKELKTLQNN
jgi:hypothetical protein